MPRFFINNYPDFFKNAADVFFPEIYKDLIKILEKNKRKLENFYKQNSDKLPGDLSSSDVKKIILFKFILQSKNRNLLSNISPKKISDILSKHDNALYWIDSCEKDTAMISALHNKTSKEINFNLWTALHVMVAVASFNKSPAILDNYKKRIVNEKLENSAKKLHDISDEQGWDALAWAIYFENRDVIKKLLEIMEEKNIFYHRTVSFAKQQAVELTMENDQIEILELVTENGIDLIDFDCLTEYPLLEQAISTENFSAIRILLEKATDFDPQSTSAKSSLYLAIYEKNAAAVYLLLEKGVVIDRENDKEINEKINQDPDISFIFDMHDPAKNPDETIVKALTDEVISEGNANFSPS